MLYLTGTPILHVDSCNHRSGFIVECGEYEAQIVWLENGKGNHYHPTTTRSLTRYVSEAKKAQLEGATDTQIALFVEQARDAMFARKHLADIKRKNERLERERYESELAAKLPQDCKAVIIAEYMIDKSDAMTDYFHSSASKTLILAFSKHTRDLFAEMRKAALNAPETAHLFDAPKDSEHREKYSMGGGYYLKNDYRHSDGWRISKQILSYKKEATREDRINGFPNGEWRIPETNKAQAKKAKKAQSAPINLTSDFEVKEGTKPGFVEIHFQDKPSTSIRDQLKKASFRWSNFNKCWYGKADNLPAIYK